MQVTHIINTLYLYNVNVFKAMFTFFGHMDLHVILFSTTSAWFLVVLRLMHLCHSHIIILPYANIDQLVYCAILYRP